MKILFFVNIIRQARCIRRIEDFISSGYDVEVCGFDREGDNRQQPAFSYKTIGIVSRSSSYFKRLMMMRRTIKEEMACRDKDTVCYIFSLDVAIAFMLNGGLKRKYVYEVSDLMELEVNNKLLSSILTRINRYIIKRSVETIVTSPGFEDYLFPNKKPSNISIVPNKLDKRIMELGRPRPKAFDSRNITIGFTGAIRNKAIYNFIEVVGEYFPNINLVFYGIFTDDKIYSVKIRNAIERYGNVSYNGTFKNPDDFPEIYSHIDMVLCLYTAKGNDRVLEPNKLYESIFFEKPIIVSKNTFTGRYVESVGIGYTVDGEDKEDIMSFLASLNAEEYLKRVARCSKIPKEYTIDDTTKLFSKLKTVL